MERRVFLKTCAALAGARSLAAKSLYADTLDRLFEPASRPVPGIIDVGSTKQAFLDEYLIFEASKISTFMTRPEKYAKNPILIADREWEPRSLGIEITGNTVIYDEEEKLFKMWYLAWVLPDGRRPWCYATSQDGYNWEKPELGIYEFNGSKRNNILAAWGDPNYFNVIKDPHDPEPKRRYKAFGEYEGPRANHTGGAAVAFSADGLHWHQYEGNPVVRHGPDMGDAPSILGWDPHIKKYVFWPRPGAKLAPEIYGNGDHRHIRSYAYSTSEDFIHWTPSKLMMTPDYKDRVDYQYMQLTGGIDGQFYVGFNAMLETFEQTWDVFLMTSRDGFHWNWVDRKLPFLGRGEVGTYDAGYMTPSGPIFHDGKVWIYYGAFSGAHSQNQTKLGENNLTIALCTLPQNRWVGLMAGPYRGTIVTHPLRFEGSKLIVDIEAAVPQLKPRVPPRFDECDVRVSLEGRSGGRLDGFTADRCEPLTASGVQEVKWKGVDVGDLAGQPVRVRFDMRNVALYSLQFV